MDDSFEFLFEKQSSLGRQFFWCFHLIIKCKFFTIFTCYILYLFAFWFLCVMIFWLLFLFTRRLPEVVAASASLLAFGFFLWFASLYFADLVKHFLHLDRKTVHNPGLLQSYRRRDSFIGLPNQYFLEKGDKFWLVSRRWLLNSFLKCFHRLFYITEFRKNRMPLNILTVCYLTILP